MNSKHILEHIKEAHIIVNRDSGAVEYVNKAARSIFGLSEKTLSHSPDARFQCIHEADRPRVRALYERIIRHGTAYTIQYRVIRPNGTVKWVEEYSRVVEYDGIEYIMASLQSSGGAFHRSEEKQLRTLIDVGSLLSNAKSHDQTTSEILKSICTGLDWDCGSIWRLDSECKIMSLVREWCRHESVNKQHQESKEYFLAADAADSEFDSALRAGIPLWITDIDDSDFPLVFRNKGRSGLRTSVCIPIASRDSRQGLLILYTTEPREQQQELVQTLMLIGTLVAAFLEDADAVSDDSESVLKRTPELIVSPRSGRIVDANHVAASLFADAGQDVEDIELGEIFSADRREDQNLVRAMQLDRVGQSCTFRGRISTYAESYTAATLTLRRIETHAASSEPYLVAVTVIMEESSDKKPVNQPHTIDQLMSLQNMPAALALIDTERRINFASDKWLEDFDLTRSQTVGKTYSSVFTQSRSRWENILTRALAGDSFSCDEDEFVLPSGAKEWVSWSVAPWKSPDGRINGVILCTRLVTKERRARESLKRAETKYHALFDNMLDGFAYHRIITNENGEPVDYVFLEVNQAFEDITGLKRSELIGRRVTEVLPEITNDERDWIATYGQVALSGGDLKFEDYSKDLDRWFSVAAYCPKKGYFVVVVEEITKRKVAELELIEAGRTISTLLANLPGMAYRCVNERSWKMEYVSDGVLELTGYEAEELLANAAISYNELIVPEDRDYVWEEIQSALRQDRPFRLSYRIRSRDGDIKWVWEQGCAVRSDSGEVIALEGFITDVTERKQAEEAVRSREEFYRELIDESTDMFSIVDENCNFLYQSTSIESTLGYSPEEMIQTNGMTYIHPDDVAEVREQFTRILTEKAEPTVTYRFRAANGTWRLLESKGRNLLDNPHVRGIVINSRDITERSRVQLELMKLATAVEQAAEAIIITDTEGNIQYVNPAFEEMSGYDRSSAIGRNPRFLRSGENSPALYRQMWEQISAGKHWVGRLVNKTRDAKEYIVEVAVSPMKNDDGTIINYVAVQRNITKEKELEDQLRQAQKLEAVGRLASGIAHDFNNLLAGIRGFAELISLDTSTDPKIKSFASEIVTASGRAADLTGQLLAFSRQGNYLSVPVDIHTVIGEVEGILRHTMEKNINLETQLDATNTMIKGDPSQIQSAILNLAVNARDAMPNGGVLTIKTWNREADLEYKEKHDLITDQTHFVAVEVVDTGTGIPADQLAHIFDPFFTTKPQGEGTGLGLAGVYGCAKNHKGGVFVESEQGVGSSFTILLPLIEDSSADSQQDETPDSTAAGNHILIVDDQDETLQTARRILVKAGYKVTICSTSGEFLKILEEEEQVDLALIDVVMPGISGRDLFNKAREIRPEICVMLMSGYSDHQVHESLDAGVAGFLPKPFDAKNLLQKVRELLMQGHSVRYSSGQIG